MTVGLFWLAPNAIAQQESMVSGTAADARTGSAMPDDKAQSKRFTLENIFDLESAANPRISPDGKKIVYLRNFMDKMKDRRRSNMWMVNVDGSRNRPLTSDNNNYGSPRWSPSGDRLLYTSSKSGSNQLYIRWMDTGQSAKITNLTHSPGGATWSPDGKRIAFTMFMPQKRKPMIDLPAKPKGAHWAKPARVIDKLHYQQDGVGYVKDGYSEIFIMSSKGGDMYQLTFGPYDYRNLQWSKDGEYLFVTSNRHKNRVYNSSNTEIYRINVKSGVIKSLTDRKGPDGGAVISPDGSKIAYLGHDETYLMYQPSSIYIMNVDGTGKHQLNINLDRNPRSLTWSEDGTGLYIYYNDKADGKVAFVTLDGQVSVLVNHVLSGGAGRPYSGGSYSESKGVIAYTYATSSTPTNIAVVHRGSINKAEEEPMVLTNLNQQFLSHIELGKLHQISYKSEYDELQIEGWYITPPNFDPNKKYPLLLEIHGGPLLSYSPVFSGEDQLYAAAGYVVLYINPRGSTSYGKNFAEKINRDYPHHDYDDLMSGVNVMTKKDFIDKSRLYVTGGSGGGCLTAWIVGHTNRFKAAVVQKPVTNWYDFALTADMGYTAIKYWIPGVPWKHLDAVMKRSPISYVGNVTTPTMLIDGDEDLRTPNNQSQQFYLALKIRKVPTKFVLISGAGHGIGRRPSNQMRKVAYVLKWLKQYQ